jgi:hypothetical protein
MLLARCVIPLIAVAVVGSAQQSPTPQSLPTPALYFMFFKASAQQQTPGQPANNPAFIGLSPSERNIVAQAGASFLGMVAEKDRQANAIIQAERAKFPGGRLPSANALPPPNPDLKLLTQQRDDLANAQIEALRAALGAEAFSKLDQQVRTFFSKSASSPRVMPPQAPRTHPAGPLTSTPGEAAR